MLVRRAWQLAIAMAMIPLNDALIKLMSADMPLAEIGLDPWRPVDMIVLVVFTGGVGSMLALPARAFWSFCGRGICLFSAMILYFVPLGSLPLPTVITIFFVSPLLITLLSVPFLDERIGVHRMLSVCMGLIGALVITRPVTADFQIEAVEVFGVALSYAAFQIWTRRLKLVGNLSAMVTVQQLCYITGFLPILLANYFMPRAASDNATLDFLFRAPVMPGMQDAGFLIICSAAVLFLSMASSNAYR